MLQPLQKVVWLLLSALEIEEVGERDNEEGDEQNSPECNDNTDKSSSIRLWIEVTIPDCCHRDQCKPETVGNRVEVLAWLLAKGSFEDSKSESEEANTKQ